MDFEELDEEEKPKRPMFPLSMYISEGNKYLRLHLYEKAITCFNAALAQVPGDTKSLVGLGKCYIRQGRYSEAKQKAETILNSHPKSIEGMMLMGEAYYFLGDLEKAFLTYYNAYTIRPNCKALKLGFQLCQSAIDNALDANDSFVLDEQDIEEIINILDKYSS